VLDFFGWVFADNFIRDRVSNANDYVVSVGIDDELGVGSGELTRGDRGWVTLTSVAARAGAWMD
jgi:hypothetical protein